jgi:hypothetical protein
VKFREPITLRLKGTYLPSGVGAQIVNANSVKNYFLGSLSTRITAVVASLRRTGISNLKRFAKKVRVI